MKRTYARYTKPLSHGTLPCQLRIRIKWQTWSWLERMASATRSYSVIYMIYTHKFSLQILTNLENDLGGPSKSRNSIESQKFPSLKFEKNWFITIQIPSKSNLFSSTSLKLSYLPWILMRGENISMSLNRPTGQGSISNSIQTDCKISTLIQLSSWMKAKVIHTGTKLYSLVLFTITQV